MKARVKKTGELVEVHTCVDADFVDMEGNYYWEHELFFGSLDTFAYEDPDYWTRLEHQYAGMAMQGICANQSWDKCTWEVIANDAYEAAHALVEKMKEEK